MENAHFEVLYKGNLRCIAKHLRSGSIIQTDAPVDNFGKGEAFSPTDLLCISLATCMITTIGIKYIEKQINLENTKIFIQKIMTKEPPRRIDTINIEFEFDKNLVLSNTEKEIIERVANKCPVKYSLNTEINISLKFIW